MTERALARGRAASSPTSMPPLLSEQRAPLAFFLKLLAVYGLWYVFYDLWLLPDGRLDAWLSLRVAGASGSLLSLFAFEPTVDGRLVRLAGTAGILVANGCNGLSTLGLFIGFVCAYPGAALRRAVFLPLGMVVIVAANVARLACLALLQRYWPEAFDFVHSLGASALFYLVVFVLWMAWVHYGSERLPPLPPARPPEEAYALAGTGASGIRV